MKRISIFSAAAVCVLSIAACTKNFESYNTNPCAPTEEQMMGDNFLQNALLRPMMYPLGEGQQNESQMIDQLCGYELGRSIATVNPFGNAGNYYTYDPRSNWIGSPFTTIMPQIYNSYFKIVDLTGKEGLVYNWALLLRVMGTQHLSDIYGPVPYSKVGGGAYSVGYDDMMDLYPAFFEDLDAAIAGLKEAIESQDGVIEYLKSADYIYQGDLRKWVKLANTFRLRMAMRLTNVYEPLAREQAAKAVQDSYGLLEYGDAAWSTYNDGQNPLYRAAYSWGGEFMISADLTTFLIGYGDPRLPVYATKASGTGTADDDNYVGVRNGVEKNADTKAGHNKLSNLNIGIDDPLLFMSAAESYFLRAEAALRGYISGDAAGFYREGIRVSMKERGITDNGAIDAYLAGSSCQADYTCASYPDDTCDHVSNVGVTFAQDFQDQLEQILTQKWLASFPNSWEAWADFRRTGYPKHFPIVDNKSIGTADPVDTERGMRRIPFPPEEANTNKENYDEAVQMIGGNDLASVDLWWAR